MRLIDADALIEKFGGWYVDECTESGFIGTLKDILATEPTVQPGKAQHYCEGTTSALNNQVNLCDSCTYTYPECPSEKDDVIFGNGIGNDNICACNKYQPTVQPVATDTISKTDAVEHLRRVLEATVPNTDYDEGFIDGVEFGISTVSTMPTIQPIATDTISRQAAIDAIANCTNCGNEKTLREYVTKHSLENGWTGGVLDALNAVQDLPTVQPEKRTKEHTETHACDLISRQAAIDALQNCRKHCIDQFDRYHIDIAENQLRNLPIVQPEPKNGKWSDGYRWQRCSLCKQTGKKSWNYCPNCGADMRGEKDG